MMQLKQGGSTYCLREMELTDLPTLLLIESQCHSHPWSEASFHSSITSSHQCSVLEKNSAIVAYIITSTAADEAELLNISVAPEYQRRGLGSLLLDSICASFNSSIQTVFLEVRESNAPAISLYDTLGFNAIGQRDNYYPASKGRGREHAIMMAKTL